MPHRRIRVSKRGKNQRLQQWTVVKRCARSLFYEPLEDRRLLAIVISAVEDGSQGLATTEETGTSSGTDYSVDIPAVVSGTDAGGGPDAVEVVSDAAELNVGLDSSTDSTAVDSADAAIDGGSDNGSDAQPIDSAAGLDTGLDSSIGDQESAGLTGGISQGGSISQDSGSSTSVETGSIGTDQGSTSTDGTTSVDGTGGETSSTDGSASDSGTTSDPPPSGRIDVSLTADEIKPDSRTGEVAQVPDSLEWVSEWGSFYVSIWASSMGNAAAAMGGASVLMTYDTSLFTAVSVQFGPAFAGQTQSIDDALGQINLEAMTTVLDIGVGRPTLVAQVWFAATDADPGVMGLDAQDLKLKVDDAYVDFIGRRASDPVVESMPHTQVVPVPYDINNDGHVSLQDFSYFAAEFMKVGTDVGADYDLSGRVDFADFAWFAGSFGKTRSAETDPVYPDALVDYWMGRRPAPASFAVSDSQPNTEQAALTDDPAAPIVNELPGTNLEPTAIDDEQFGSEVSAAGDAATEAPESGGALDVVVRGPVLVTLEVRPADTGESNVNATVETIPSPYIWPLLQSLPEPDDGLPATDFTLHSLDTTDDLDVLLTHEPLDPTLIDDAFAASN